MRFTSPALVGRGTQLATLTRALDAAGAGHGSAVALAAAPGLGKSRLLRELAQFATTREIPVALGRATPGPSAPFRPLTEALLAADRRHRIRTLAEARGTLPALSMFLPTWSAADDSLTGEIPLAAAADALLRSLSAVKGAPFLIGLEDLHWADADTLAVVEYLADNIADTAILLVGSFRPEPPAAAELFAALQARASAATERLEELGRADTGELVRACLGGTSLPDVERFVYERSEGNPLLAEELLAGLHSSGALTREAATWRVSSRIAPQVPHTLVEAVRQRVNHLDIDTRRVVHAAAVLGRRFDWRAITVMTGIDPDDVLASLHAAGQAQLVEVADGIHQFRHVLTRDAVLDDLTVAERQRLAERGLAAVEASADHPALAALAELAGDYDQAVNYLRAAAAKSVTQGALASAVSTLRHAEVLATDAHSRLNVLGELAAALALAGRPADAHTVLDEALSAVAGSPPVADEVARLHLIGARIGVLAGDWPAALNSVERAQAAPAMSQAVEAEVLAVRAHVMLNVGRTEDAARLAEQAVFAALNGGQPEVACEALEVIGRHLRFIDPAESTARLERAVELAADAGLNVWHLRALHELAVNEAFITWRPERLGDVRAEAERQGAVLTLAVVDLHEAGTLLIGGERDQGLAVSLRCLEACRRYQLSMLPIALIHVAAGHALRGDHARVESHLAEALSLAGDDQDVASQAEAWVRGNLALSAGNLDAWRVHLERGMGIVDRDPATIPSPWRGQWVLAATALGDDHAVEKLRSSHASKVSLNQAYLALADGVRHGRSGRSQDASAAFDDGEALLAGGRCELPRHLARVLAARAALSDGWGNPELWLREALAWFTHADYPGLAALTRRLMREGGLPVPRRGRGESTVPPGLRALGVTSREMDVLLLVAKRLSNQEIADQLHLSVRTIEKYVGSLLSKSDTSSRRDLAALVSPLPGPGITPQTGPLG